MMMGPLKCKNDDDYDNGDLTIFATITTFGTSSKKQKVARRAGTTIANSWSLMGLILVALTVVVGACSLAALIESKELPALSRTDLSSASSNGLLSVKRDSAHQAKLINEIINGEIEEISRDLSLSCPSFKPKSQIEKITHYLDRVSSKLYERLSANPGEALAFYEGLSPDSQMSDQIQKNDEQQDGGFKAPINHEQHLSDYLAEDYSAAGKDNAAAEEKREMNEEEVAFYDALDWFEIEDEYVAKKEAADKRLHDEQGDLSGLDLDSNNNDDLFASQTEGQKISAKAVALSERSIMTSLLAMVRDLIMSAKTSNQGYATKRTLAEDGQDKAQQSFQDALDSFDDELDQAQHQKQQHVQHYGTGDDAQQAEDRYQETYSFYDDLDGQYLREYHTITSIMYGSAHIYTSLAPYLRRFEKMPLIGSTLKQLRSVGFRFADYVKMLKHMERDYINLLRQDEAGVKSVFLLNCKYIATIILNYATGNTVLQAATVEAVVFRLFWVLGTKIVQKLLKCSVPRMEPYLKPNQASSQEAIGEEMSSEIVNQSVL